MNDLTINEQNAVGDWLMLVGQVLQTNASQAQILEDRAQEVEEEKTKDTLETIEKTLERMQQEINHFKKK